MIPFPSQVAPGLAPWADGLAQDVRRFLNPQGPTPLWPCAIADLPPAEAYPNMALQLSDTGAVAVSTFDGSNWSWVRSIPDLPGAVAASVGYDIAASPGVFEDLAIRTGYLGEPIRALSANDQLHSSDVGKMICQDHPGGYFITIYPVSVSPWPAGCWFELYSGPGAAPCPIIPQPGVNLYWANSGLPSGTRTLGTNAIAKVRMFAADNWIMDGEGIS